MNNREHIRKKLDEERSEKIFTFLSHDTGRSLPDWMLDPACLPKYPPRRQETSNG